jgi:allophanate hydrolase
MDVASLSTLVDWTSAYGAGASPRALLLAQRQRLGDRPTSSGSHAPAQRRSRPRSMRSKARAAAFADRSAALAALPLFGVPFAVKDNIDVAGFPTDRGLPGIRLRASAATRQRSRS